METEGEEEEEDENEQAHLLKSQPTSLPVQPIATATMDTSNASEEEKEAKRIRRRKQLRFRWHFLYTILRNYHLFDLRKGVQSRLACLHVQRSNLVDEQQLTTTITMEIPTTAQRAAETAVFRTQAELVYFIFIS